MKNSFGQAFLLLGGLLACVLVGVLWLLSNGPRSESAEGQTPTTRSGEVEPNATVSAGSVAGARAAVELAPGEGVLADGAARVVFEVEVGEGLAPPSGKLALFLDSPAAREAISVEVEAGRGSLDVPAEWNWAAAEGQLHVMSFRLGSRGAELALEEQTLSVGQARYVVHARSIGGGLLDVVDASTQQRIPRVFLEVVPARRWRASTGRGYWESGDVQRVSVPHELPDDLNRVELWVTAEGYAWGRAVVIDEPARRHVVELEPESVLELRNVGTLEVWGRATRSGPSELIEIAEWELQAGESERIDKLAPGTVFLELWRLGGTTSESFSLELAPGEHRVIELDPNPMPSFVSIEGPAAEQLLGRTFETVGGSEGVVSRHGDKVGFELEVHTRPRLPLAFTLEGLPVLLYAAPLEAPGQFLCSVGELTSVSVEMPAAFDVMFLMTLGVQRVENGIPDLGISDAISALRVEGDVVEVPMVTGCELTLSAIIDGRAMSEKHLVDSTGMRIAFLSGTHTIVRIEGFDAEAALHLEGWAAELEVWVAGQQLEPRTFGTSVDDDAGWVEVSAAGRITKLALPALPGSLSAQEVVLPELQGDPFVEHEVNVANLTGAPR